MEALIWAGALVSLLGLLGLVYCILGALKIRKSTADEDTKRLALKRVVIINMAALGGSALGLMLIILGILLRK